MTISGERTGQLDTFCRVTGFTSDFLSFIVVALNRFFRAALRIISFSIWLSGRKVAIILSLSFCPF